MNCSKYKIKHCQCLYNKKCSIKSRSTIKKDFHKSLKELQESTAKELQALKEKQENTAKQVMEMNKTILELKGEVDTIKKTQSEATLEIETLGKRSGTIDTSINNRIQEMEERIYRLCIWIESFLFPAFGS